MGLINLKTNLKSLQFGYDTRGGGSSGLPYIKTGLPEDSPAGEYLAGIARTSADWPLRGGEYSTIAATTDAVRISRFLTDFPRGSIFTAKQVGLQKSNPKIETGGVTNARLNTQTYNLNANLLAQVLLEGDGTHIPRPGANTNELGPDGQKNKYEYIVSHKNTSDNRLVTLFNTKVNPNLLDNVISLGATQTLGIPVNNDNTLFDYVGGPDSLYGEGNTIISRVVNTPESWKIYKTQGYSNTKFSPKDTLTNQLIIEGKDASASQILASGIFNNILRNKFPKTFTTVQTTEELPNISTDENGNLVTSGTGIFDNVYIKQENLQSGYLDNLIEKGDTSAQQGGTEIAGDYIRPETVPVGMPVINSFGNTMAYSALLASKGNDLAAKPILQDFRSSSIDSQNGELTPQAKNYNDKQINIATRLGIGNPGARTNTNRKYLNDDNGRVGQDKVNMIPLYTNNGDAFTNKNLDDIRLYLGKNAGRDMIKFAFEVMDNDSPSMSTKVHFRAFITSFTDNHSSEWSNQKYMGRGENFYAYQGFTRDVSFTFKVAAQSKQEMLPLYQKLNHIVSSLYPDYQTGTSFMRGNLTRLTIGEYFYRTPGIIKSMNISVDDNYPWEIKYTEPEMEKDKTGKKDVGGFDFPNANGWAGSQDFKNSNSDADMMELPQILNVSVTFTPILNELPSYSKYDPANSRIDRKGILISKDVGFTENFIQRTTNYFIPKPTFNTEDETPEMPPTQK